MLNMLAQIWIGNYMIANDLSNNQADHIHWADKAVEAGCTEKDETIAWFKKNYKPTN